MTEILIILFLLVGNGLFAMAEIALVSARRGRLQQLAKNGSKGAQTALDLLENPERFLSSVQIGISLVGVLSGAFGGAALSGKLEPYVAQVPAFEPHALTISFAIVVTTITYFSLIIGELVPKGLALRNAEAIAVKMAPPMAILAKLASPLVRLLAGSTKLVMRLFGSGGEIESGHTREEMEVIVREGILTGTVAENESEMVEGVFDLRDLLAEQIMLPKPKVLFLQREDNLSEVSAQVAASSQTIFPVREGSRDEICGMVSLRELFTSTASEEPVVIGDLISPPLFVAENQPALSLLETLRSSSHGAALVADEFGTIRGLVTLNDLVEEIVGELRPPQERVAQIKPAGNNAWTVDAMMEMNEVIQYFPELKAAVELENKAFQTLAGYLVHLADRLPEVGETFRTEFFEFQVLEMDRQRLEKVLVRKLKPEPAVLIDPES